MKTKSLSIRIIFLVVLVITIALTSLAFNRPLQTAQTPTPTALTDSIEAAADTKTDPGYTDGIILIAVIIVSIIVIPILLRWHMWANGKRK